MATKMAALSFGALIRALDKKWGHTYQKDNSEGQHHTQSLEELTVESYDDLLQDYLQGAKK